MIKLDKMDMGKTNDIVVTILTLAYNHKPYIRQCLDGIVMQRTNFKFELLIHDDASTDGTADIIREYESKYPNIIKPIYQKDNQYSKEIPIGVTYLYPRAKGKYIALCEGDDYWIDPLKLQKQVDFLEANPEFVMCSTCYTIYNQSNHTMGATLPLIERTENIVYSLNDYIADKVWYTQPLTSIFRNCKKVLDAYQKCNYRKDATMFYMLLKEGKGMLLKDVTGIYRHHAGGIWIGVSNLERLLGGLKAIKGICEFEGTNESAKYLYNYMFFKGFLGKNFWLKYYNLYWDVFKVIVCKLGWKAGLRLLSKNGNIFVAFKRILLN